MCNAYNLGRRDRIVIETDWEKEVLKVLDELDGTELVRPTTPGVVVRKEGSALIPEIMRWGFHRHFNPSINNTRSEKVIEGGSMWSAAWRDRRCLIAVQSFYEWSGPKGSKQAHRISTHENRDRWMWFAGIWEENKEMGRCYSMLTSAANSDMAPIHDRMPVILERGTFEHYLDEESPIDLLVPWKGKLFTPECLSPLAKKKNSE